MANKTNLVPVSAATFYPGINIEAEIYYKYHNSYIVICQETTIDEQMLQKLQQSEQMNRMLYVNQEAYLSIVEQSRQHQSEQMSEQKNAAAPPPSPPVKKRVEPQHLNEMQVKIQLANEYESVTGRAASMLQSLADANPAAVEQSEQLSGGIERQLEMTDPSILLQCINTMRSAHTYLYSHSTNVAMLNGMIGQWLRLSAEEVHALVQTGLLHDLGKLRMPADLLNKPGKLSPEEYTIMKDHPVTSEKMLQESGITDTRILQGARYHHERMNGMGYPDRLHGNGIPLFARITAVSDVYDAMVAQRPYQERKTPFAILHLFSTDRFSDLDIEIINVFLENITRELVGRTVVLSDGRRGKVSFVNPKNFAFPLIKVGGQIIATNENLRCVEMENLLSMLG